MNNNVVVGWPNVPPEIPGWTFYNALRVCEQDWGRNDETKVAHRLARRNLLKQLKLMGDTVCQACGGRAHRARDCPTNLRLGMLSSSCVEN